MSVTCTYIIIIIFYFNKLRLSSFHHPVFAYDFSILPPKRASINELTAFHSNEYIDCLQNYSDLEKDEDINQFGLGKQFKILFTEAIFLNIVKCKSAFSVAGYDCPMFEDVYECVSAIAGGTIVAAEALTTGQASVAINWQGGWHHAQRYLIITYY
jgi:acetoin utilization deacetylase AcuC-like enzyme